jgi:putative hemolysin
MLVFLICLLAFLLASSAFFSASETALFSLRRAELSTFAERGGRTDKRIVRALDRPGHTLTTILLGNTLVNVAGAAVATVICGMLLGPRGIVVAIVTDTVLVLVFGEIIPKSIAVSFPVTIARALIGPLSTFSFAVRPVTAAVASFSNLVLDTLGLVRREETERRVSASAAELRMLIHDLREEEAFTKEETRIAMNILEFSETRAEEIMTPRVDIVAIQRNSTREEVAALMRAAKHSKLPVYGKSVDEITGYISTKEFFLWSDRPVDSFIKPVLFVPSSRRLEGLLQEMEKKRTYLVIVVNEYGETLGLITKEDILEEIVGEIYDEYETDQVPVRYLPGGVMEVDGKVSLDLVREELGVRLGPTEAVTVSGFIFERLGRLPSRGASFKEAGYLFEVLDVKRRRVLRCRVSKLRE